MNLILKQIIVVSAWLLFGAILGYAGVLVSSHIPVLILGFIFGGAGAIIHGALLAFDSSLSYIFVGSTVTVAAGLVTLLWAPLPVLPYALICYFVFGCLICLLLEVLLDINNR